MSNTYGVSVSDIRNALTAQRNAIRYWKANTSVVEAKRDGIIADHVANIRDLRVLLTNVRFPHNTFPHNTYASEFTPVIVATPETVSAEDTEAFIAALVDSADEMATDVPYLVGQDLIDA